MSAWRVNHVGERNKPRKDLSSEASRAPVTLGCVMVVLCDGKMRPELTTSLLRRCRIRRQEKIGSHCGMGCVV